MTYDYREALLEKAAELQTEADELSQSLRQAKTLQAQGLVPDGDVAYWNKAVRDTDNAVWELFKIFRKVEAMSYMDFMDLTYQRRAAHQPYTDLPF